MIRTKYLHIHLITLIFLTLNSCESSQSISNTSPNTDMSNDNVIQEDSNNDEFYEKKQTDLKLNDANFDNRISSVLCYKSGFELSEPIIQLNSSDRITLRFDLLSSELASYQYEIIHCDSDWKQSSLLTQDYSNGFFQNNVNDFKYSFNTEVNYVNYWIEFPNEYIQLTKSGNYIIKVFQNNNPNSIVLTRRFMVYENLVGITESIKRATNLDDRNYKQEIDFTLNTANLELSNPFANLNPIIRQNYRWDNAIQSLKPLFIKGTEFSYDYNNGENVFDGGNEFRYFDISNIRQKTDRINSIIPTDTQTNIVLVPEQKRTYSNYSSQLDFNGNYIIRNRLGQDSHSESDYVYVYFNFYFDHKLSNGDVYIFGALSNWNYLDKYKMSYNEQTKSYQKRLYLKQGHYNYLYMFKAPNKNTSDIEFLEGSHYETQNNYSITVYYRDPSFNYDRIIGFKSFISNL